MPDSQVVLISEDEELIRRFQTAGNVLGVSGKIIRSAKEFSEFPVGAVSSAVFFDPCNSFCAAGSVGARLKENASGLSIPLVLLADVLPTGSAAFDSLFCGAVSRRLYRKDFYRILNQLNITEKSDADSSLWLQSISRERIEKFLQTIENTPLEPRYTEGDFHYPEVEHFFAGDQDDCLLLLRELSERGRLERKIFDTIHRCPQCHSPQINFRETCPQCKGIDFQQTEMFHHFSCGYVGASTEFGGAGREELVCPKCSRILRHIGLDYEKLIQASHCSSCGADFSVPGVRCLCLCCRKDFEPQEAVMENIYSYRVNKLSAEKSNADGGEAEDGTVSRATFLYLLRQSFKMAGECGIPLALITLDLRRLNPEQQNAFLRALVAESDSAEAVWRASAGVLVLLPFRYSRENAESKLAEVNRRLKKLIDETGLPVVSRGHAFPVEPGREAGEVLSVLLDGLQ